MIQIQNLLLTDDENEYFHFISLEILSKNISCNFNSYCFTVISIKSHFDQPSDFHVYLKKALILSVLIIVF